MSVANSFSFVLSQTTVFVLLMLLLRRLLSSSSLFCLHNSSNSFPFNLCGSLFGFMKSFRRVCSQSNPSAALNISAAIPDGPGALLFFIFLIAVLVWVIFFSSPLIEWVSSKVSLGRHVFSNSWKYIFGLVLIAISPAMMTLILLIVHPALVLFLLFYTSCLSRLWCLILGILVRLPYFRYCYRRFDSFDITLHVAVSSPPSRTYCYFLKAIVLLLFRTPPSDADRFT